MYGKNYFKSILFILLLAFTACKKAPTKLGNSILPEQNNLTLFNTDTFSIIAQTIREDSLLTSALTRNTLGYIDEPTFGKTISNLYIQIGLPFNNVNLGDFAYTDSLVLYLDIPGYYGDATTTQTINVYKLTNDLVAGTEHYSDEITSADIELLGAATYTPSSGSNQVAIYLKKTLADTFLAQSGTNNFVNNDNFINFFKGFFITIDTNNLANDINTTYSKTSSTNFSGLGNILFVNLASANSKLSLYYGNETTDSLVFNFILNNNPPHYNQISHNYNNALANNYINTASTKGDSIVFLQSLAGLKAKLNFPSIQNLKNVLINKAELTVTIVNDPNNIDSIFSAPSQLICLPIVEDGSNNFSFPDLFAGPNYYGGTKTTENNKSVYTFNLARHFQNIVDGQTDYGLYIITSDDDIFSIPFANIPFTSAQIANRLIIGGGNHSSGSIKLNLLYTKHASSVLK